MVETWVVSRVSKLSGTYQRILTVIARLDPIWLEWSEPAEEQGPRIVE